MSVIDKVTVSCQARQLRRKFEGHTQTVRDIVALMSDEHLVQEYEFFHKEAVEYARGKNAAAS
jgi:hypothetical protein